MTRVHVANIDFEFELGKPSGRPLEVALEKNPVCLQLHFLPLLYADSDEIVAVTSLPEPSFLDLISQWRGKLPTLALMNQIEPFLRQECYSWGSSKQAAVWAAKRKMAYNAPKDWMMIQEVNSKAFSHQYCTLRGASLIRDQASLSQWLASFSGKKVLKTCFGLSGRGHFFVENASDYEEALQFCEREWKQKRPIVAEPWMERVFDFATQWTIESDGRIIHLGSTVFETSSEGVYLGSIAGDEAVLFNDYLPFLEEHKQITKKMLEDISQKEFYGNVGVDALLYRCADSGGIKLYPIVEINARCSMSWVAIKVQQKWFSGQNIRFTYQRSEDDFSLLPTELILSNGKMIQFGHRLTIEVL